MFGAGEVIDTSLDDEDSYWYYPAPYYSYGCGAAYSYGWGGFYSSHLAYGPLGGVGHVAAYYNPWTGGFARTAAVRGAHGAAFAREAYNPFTNTHAARMAGVTPYGAYSRGLFERNGNWVQGGREITSKGSARWARGAEGNAAVTLNAAGPGGRATIVKGGGELYAAHGGNVYRNDGGGWSEFADGRWNSVRSPEPEGDDGVRARMAGEGQDTRKEFSMPLGNYSRTKSINPQPYSRLNLDPLPARSYQIDRGDWDTLQRDSLARTRSNSMSNRARESRVDRGVRPGGGFGGVRVSGGFRGGGRGRR
jgi:hypothetical protein